MTPRQVIAAIAVVAAAFAAGLTIIRAPLYARYSADECHHAYRAATTRGDTARVDLHPYAAAHGHKANRRCGEVRARLVATDADIIAP